MIFSLVHLKRVTERNKIVAFGKKKKEAGNLKVKKDKVKKRPSEKKKKKEHSNKSSLFK